MLHHPSSRIMLAAVLLPALATAGALTDLLIAQVGVTQPQADGGAGSIFKRARALLAGTALGDKLQAAQALAPGFQQLGMNQGMVARFLPVAVDYVKSVGGKSSSKLLTHALGC